jgi:hypothetical protein
MYLYHVLFLTINIYNIDCQSKVNKAYLVLKINFKSVIKKEKKNNDIFGKPL